MSGAEGDLDSFRESLAALDEAQLDAALVAQRAELARFDEIYAKLREEQRSLDDESTGELGRVHGLAVAKLRLAENALVRLRQREERAEELEAHEEEMRESGPEGGEGTSS